MTTAALDKKTTEQANKNSRDIIEKPNDTLQIISMLLNYMAGGEKRAKFTLAVIVRIIALLGLISLPFLTGQAINVLQNPGGTIAELQGWVIYALIAGGVFLVMTLFAEQMFADLATQGLQGLQTHLFSHMQTLSLNFFDRQPIGELLSRITNDTEVVSLFYEQAVGPIIRASITIILAFLIMVAIDWRLTIVALLIVPAILILTNVIERISTPAFA